MAEQPVKRSRASAWRGAPVAYLLATAFCLVAVACSDSMDGTAGRCAADADCGEDRCEEGRCVPADAGSGNAESSAHGLPTGVPTGTTTERPSGSGTTTARPSDVPGGYLDPCVRDADCLSNVCISSPLGRVCTRPCALDEDCAPAAGWRCQLIAGERDLVRVCYPDATDLCEPCTADTDCGRLQDRCLGLDDGTFCGLDCSTGRLCPAGYVCVEHLEGEWVQCVPDDNRCDDCDGADLQNDPFHCGACDHTCSFDNADGECVNGQCLPGACEEGWDNCDEDPETGCEQPVLEDPLNCGSCGNRCPDEGGIARCEAGTCVLDACPSGTLLCDGTCQAPNACGGCEGLPATPGVDSCGACDTGMWQCDASNPNALLCLGETDPQSDNENCGTACEACTSGQTCQEGACACPGDQILCEGTCQAPNVCGGCAPLGHTPGVDSCGACDTGTWQCNPSDSSALLCLGETDPQSDNENCGTSCEACTSGQTCQEGACACPGDQILCEGTCQAPNACGGCSPLGHTPGVDSCGACDTGTWQCNPTDSNALQCVGETDPQSDNANCGDSCETCTGGQTCQNGSCACPADQILCNGACRVPNACGGCDSLPATPGVTACGACSTGTWQCDPSNPDVLECVGETNPLNDDENCGSSCDVCTGGRTCQGGSCACPGGQVLCGGTCRAPNLCGGCTPLNETPGVDSCGACESGTWQCNPTNPNILQCVGETDPQTDSNNCGASCATCAGGRTCQNGSCACPAGEIVCGGLCQAPNACGGCSPLSGTPGVDACGACNTGTLQCNPSNPNNLQCIGETDPQSDDNNCGASCIACSGGQTCQGGTCACPGGQILCAGVCQAPNICGGCADLKDEEGDSCGTCGLLACSGGDLVCTGESPDLSADPENCGACGITCGPGVACTDGLCGCGPDHLGTRDSAATAWPLLFGNQVRPSGRRGALDGLQLCSGGVHWYQVPAVAQGGSVTVELGGDCAGPFAPILEFVTSTGTVQASSSGGGANGCPRLQRTLSGGSHFLRVRAPAGTEGAYDLKLTWGDVQEQEPNDNRFQANGPVHRTAEFRGMLDAGWGDPRDMYELDLRHAGTQQFQTTICGARTQIRLQNSGGSEIAIGSSSGTCSLLSVPLAPGRYYIEVAQIGGNSEYGSYRLQVNSTPVFASPPLATPAQATVLGSVPTGGESAIRDDSAEYWRFTLPSFGPLVIETRGVGRDCDLDSEIALLSADGQTVIAESSGGGAPIAGGGTCAALRGATHPALQNLAAGDYIVRVRGHQGARGPYLINVHRP